MNRGIVWAVLAVTAVGVTAATAPAGAQGASDRLLQDLRSPSTRTRIDALHALGDQAHMDAAVPMAALLLDGNDDVQFEAIEAILKLYTVRADMNARPWGVTATGRPTTLSEGAFEAGPLATIPAAVPVDVLVNLGSVMRQDETGRIRYAAGYALGVLASPALGPMPATAVEPVTNDIVEGLKHADANTRQLVARIAGRIFAETGNVPASIPVGDALVAAMNDKDGLVRRWSMDSLGYLKYDRALQALTDRASFYGKSEEGAAAFHAIARIANPASAPVMRPLVVNTYVPFRLIAIEGIGRVGDAGGLPQVTEALRTESDAGVQLAGAYTRFLLGQADVIAIADALEKTETAVQAKVYLGEIAASRPADITPLLKTPSPSTRMIAVEVLGVSRHPDQVTALEPLLKDPSPDVVAATSEAIRRLRAYEAVAGKP